MARVARPNFARTNLLNTWQNFPDKIIMRSPSGQNTDDTLTLAAIGVLTIIAEMLIHEGGGHGGVCISTGGRVTVLTALDEYCTRNSLWIDLGGPAANFLAGGLSWLTLGRMLFSRTDRTRIHLRYFLWLSMAYNLLKAAEYMPYSVLTGFGDLGCRCPRTFPGSSLEMGAAATRRRTIHLVPACVAH